MIALHVPGDGPLHRAPASAKLAALVILALGISLAPHTPATIAGTVLAVVIAYPLCGLPAHVLGRGLRRMLWLVVVLGSTLWLLVDAATALTAVGRVLALVLLADLVTATTRMGDILYVLLRLLGPLRRWRVDPEAVALTISLAITMLPVIAGFASRVGEAHRARGIRPGIRSAVPLLVMTMRHADDVGDALAARGVVG